LEHDLTDPANLELLARLRSGEPLVVVDVRPAEDYQAAHVAGAVSIPLAEVDV